ncbi:hypothetical protein V8C34DRAFT_295176 [Trichoderma compactum]
MSLDILRSFSTFRRSAPSNNVYLSIGVVHVADYFPAWLNEQETIHLLRRAEALLFLSFLSFLLLVVSCFTCLGKLCVHMMLSLRTTLGFLSFFF